MKLGLTSGLVVVAVASSVAVAAGDGCGLRVVVRDRDDRAALPGVKVIARAADDVGAGATLLTDRDGVATFKGLAPDRSYDVTTTFPSSIPTRTSWRCSEREATLEVLIDFPVSISMIALIARPGDFQGKYVAVEGVLSLRFEGHALYLSSDDLSKGRRKNALWVEATADMSSRRDELEGKTVHLVARFNGQRHGHMGLFSGSLEDVQECSRSGR